MRKFFVPALAAVFTIATLLSANIALAEVKIGVVDMQVIAAESDPAKDAQKTMNTKYGKEREQLEAQTKDLQKKAEALNKKGTEKQKLDFIREKRTLDEKARTFARKVEIDEMKIRQDMVALVFRSSYEVAKAKGFDFVVDVTAGGVLFAQKSMDITQDVLKEVNKLWKSGELKK